LVDNFTFSLVKVIVYSFTRHCTQIIKIPPKTYFISRISMHFQN